MRDAAGQLADRLHLLALAQLRLHVVQPFLLRQPFRDIGRELIGADRRPLGRDQRAEAQFVMVPHARQIVERLDDRKLLARQRARPVIAHHRQDFGPVGHRLGLVLADLRAGAEDTFEILGRGAVDRQIAMVEAQHLDQRAGGIDDVGEQLALGQRLHHPALQHRIHVAQRRLGPAALVDIDDRSDHAQKSAVIVEARNAGRHDPVIAALHLRQPIFGLEGARRDQGLAERLLRRRAVIDVDHVGPAEVQALCDVLSGLNVPGTVDIGAMAVGIGHPDHDRRIVGDVAEPRLALSRGGQRDFAVLPVAHPGAAVDHRRQDARRTAAFVGDGGIVEVEPMLLGHPLAVQHHRLVAIGERSARQPLGDDLGVECRRLRPHPDQGRAQHGRVPVAGKFGIAGIVDQDALWPPDGGDGDRGGERDGECRQPALRPGGDRPQRRRGPVMPRDQPTHLAAARQNSGKTGGDFGRVVGSRGHPRFGSPSKPGALAAVALLWRQE